MDQIPSSPLRRILIPMVGVLGLVFAMAVTPNDLVSEVAVNGFHVDAKTSATDACVSGSVADARNAGSNFYLVVLAEEPSGGATTFSGGMLTALGVDGTVLTIAPETVGYEENEGFWSPDELEAALDASLTVASDNDVARTFVNTLTGQNVKCSNQSVEGKSGWAWIVVFIIILGGVGFLIWNTVRSNRKRGVEELARAKAPVQSQIDAIANDILALETEVAHANNPEATAYFEDAAASFATAGDRLAATDDADGLLDLSHDLDTTIWRLDCVEALLDGNPLPAKPVKPEPFKADEPVLTASEPVSGGTSARAQTGLPRTLPEYQRRGARQSSYGSNQVMQALLGVGAMKMLRSSGTRAPMPPDPVRSRQVPTSRSAPAPSPTREPSPTKDEGKRTRGGGRRRT